MIIIFFFLEYIFRFYIDYIVKSWNICKKKNNWKNIRAYVLTIDKDSFFFFIILNVNRNSQLINSQQDLI